MMRNICYSLIGVAMAVLACSATPPQTTTKSAPKQPAQLPASRSGTKAPGTGSTASRQTKRSAAPRTTWRNRQTAPSPERYKEIQEALVAKGYLSPEAAAGGWGESSTEALKKFQADQNLESTGKINSLSLIAL